MDVLLQSLTERHPDLEAHLSGLTELTEMVAHQLALDGEQLELVQQAAKLHDVGKVAIPDAIWPSVGR